MGSVKRKAEVVEDDLEYLHGRIRSLARYSISDSKSLLLMMKTLVPSSLNLKLIEYNIERSNGDVLRASEILQQLSGTRDDSVVDEAVCMFDGMRKTPPDRTSVEIFSALGTPVQRELLRLYVSRLPSDTVKLDSLLFLSNLKDLQSQAQLIPTLLEMTYKVFCDGESSLIASANKGRLSSQSAAQPSSVDPQGHEPRSSSKAEESDENEEGEVVGDDEEEDEFVDEKDVPQVVAKVNSVPRCAELVLNVYRYRIAYEFLPTVFRVDTASKISRDMLEEMAISTFQFLFTYLSQFPRDPGLLGTEKKHAPFCGKNPESYMVDCLKMFSDLLHWPYKAFRDGVFDLSLDTENLLKSDKELLDILESCYQEVSSLRKQTLEAEDSESSSKRRRSAQHKTEDSGNTLRLRAAVSQFVCLFWFLLIRFSLQYFRKYRPRLMMPNALHEQAALSMFPLNMDVAFTEVATSTKECEPTILEYLSRLWAYRKYDPDGMKYTLKIEKLDKMECKIRPSVPLTCTLPETLLEGMISLDLLSSGLMSKSCSFSSSFWFSKLSKSEHLEAGHLASELSHLYSPEELRFLVWLSTSVCAHHNDGQPNRFYELQASFIKDIPKTIDSVLSEPQEPVRLNNGIWMLPPTCTTLDLVAGLMIIRWLCAVLIADEYKETTKGLEAASLACVLGQIGSATESSLSPISHFPYENIIHTIQTGWPQVRQNFMRWLTAPTKFISDASLLTTLFQMESSYVNANGLKSERSQLLQACVDSMKCSSNEKIASRLREFIILESDNIVACLKKTK